MLAGTAQAFAAHSISPIIPILSNFVTISTDTYGILWVSAANSLLVFAGIVVTCMVLQEGISAFVLFRVYFIFGTVVNGSLVPTGKSERRSEIFCARLEVRLYLKCRSRRPRILGRRRAESPPQQEIAVPIELQDPRVALAIGDINISVAVKGN